MRTGWPLQRQLSERAVPTQGGLRMLPQLRAPQHTAVRPSWPHFVPVPQTALFNQTFKHIKISE